MKNIAYLSFCLAICSFLSCEIEEIHTNSIIPSTFEKVIEQQDVDVFLKVRKVIPANDGGYVIIGEKASRLLNFDEVVGFIIILEEDGEIRTYNEFGVFSVIDGNLSHIPNDIEAIDNGYVVAVRDNSTSNTLMYVLDNTGGNGGIFGFPIDTETAADALLVKADNNTFLFAYNSTIKKVDTEGNIIWEKNDYDGFIVGLSKDFNSGEYIVATTFGPLFGTDLFRIDENGNIIKSLPGVDAANDAFSFGILPHTSGQYIYNTVEFTFLGSSVFSKLFARSGDTESFAWELELSDIVINDVKETSDGGLILGGSLANNFLSGTVGGEMILIKLNADGTEQWRVDFGGSLTETGEGVIELNDGGFLCVGTDVSISATDFFPGDKGVYLVRTNRNGTL